MAMGAILGQTPQVEVEGTLPEGGTTGQILTKTSDTNYDAAWTDMPEQPDPLPTGGTAGQVLTQGASGPKWADVPTEIPTGGSSGQILSRSGTTGLVWTTNHDIPTGGTTGQVLTKTSSTNYAAAWQTPSSGDVWFASMSATTAKNYWEVDLGTTYGTKGAAEFIFEKINNNWLKMRMIVNSLYVENGSTSTDYVAVFPNMYKIIQYYRSNILSHYPSGSNINYNTDVNYIINNFICDSTLSSIKAVMELNTIYNGPIIEMNGLDSAAFSFGGKIPDEIFTPKAGLWNVGGDVTLYIPIT